MTKYLKPSSYAALLATSLLTASPASAEVRGCYVVDASMRSSVMTDKEDIVKVFSLVLVAADETLDLTNPKAARLAIDERIMRINARAESLSKDIEDNKHWLGILSGLKSTEQNNAAIDSVKKEIANASARRENHSKTTTYHIEGYCLPDMEKGYEQGKYQPTLLGTAVRNPKGQFEFKVATP